MRKGFAIGSALLMVLMAFMVLAPSAAAEEDMTFGGITSSEEVDEINEFCGFSKKVCIIPDDGDIYVDLNEDVHWRLTITVHNINPWPMYDVVVTDRLAAELEVNSVVSISPGTTVMFRVKGNTKITWTIGTLCPCEEVTLVLEISPREKNGKQAYTSEGCYEINSGATLKYKKAIPCTGEYIQYSAHTGQVFFHVPGLWPYGVCKVCP